METFTTIAGCKIRLMRAGKGEPLLFLHGARGAAVWLPFMQKLSEAFEVIVPEHPGFGGSDTPPWLDHVGDLAYFYLDLIEEMKLDGLHLVGTSLGGWIASEIAVRRSDPLKTLVLSCPAGIHVKGLRKGDIFLWSPEETVRNLFHDQAMAEKALQQPLSDEQQMVEAKNRLSMAKLSWQPRLYNPHLAKWLHRIKLPTLILWGDDDKLIPAAYGPEFQKLIPGSRLHMIGNCGHLPQIEKMEEWVGQVTAFAKEATR